MTATPGPARVKYTIVKCTSEDPEYPVSELLAHSSQTKGWQTARFCDFPQEIGLQFEGPVHLRQVQFLSHQSKIATKVELFTALPAEGASGRYEAAQFKRLGYLSLDSNERSQFQARELKSVYVDVPALFLKIVLHKCHVNRYNIVNQVGLIALHCSGEVLSPDLSVGPPVANPTYSSNSLADRAESRADNAQAAPRGSLRSDSEAADVAPRAADPPPSRERAPPPARERVPPPAVERIETPPEPVVEPPRQQPRVAPAERAPPERTAARAPAEPVPQRAAPAERAPYSHNRAPAEPPQAMSEESRYDVRTQEKIQSLAAAKTRAVENEDYEEAKRCKEMIGRLRETGEMLKDMEERKAAAVANEDYDIATSLKAEIDRVRASVERPQNQPDSRDRNNARAQPAYSDDDAPSSKMTAPRGGHQPVTGGSNGGGGGQRFGSSGRLGASTPDASPHSGGHGDTNFGIDAVPPQGGRGAAAFNPSYDEPAPYDGGMGGGGGGPPAMRGGSPPLTGGGMHARGPSYGGDDDDGDGGYGAGYGGDDNGHDRDGRDRRDDRDDRGGRDGPGASSEAAHHLRGVPNIEDLLASPEALSAALEKDKECMLLVQLFGEYIARCIYSKTWNLRDAALQKLSIDLREGVRNGDEPNQFLQGYAMILKRTIADKNVQVSLRSGDLLQAVAHTLLQSGRIRRNEAQAALDPIMPLLVERLGEANARIDKTARDALLAFARSQHIGASFTTQYLLKPPKKKTGAAPHARVFSSRLQVLTSLASDFGVQPESRDGVPLESTVKLAMECFNNKDGEVRENSVKLVTACYLHVGLNRIEGYLSNLRPAQREVFDIEFDRASGGPGVAQRTTPSSRGGVGRVDEGYGEVSDAPASGRANRGGGGTGGPRSGGYQQEEANYEEQEVEDFTCQFCGRQDPHFTPEALDVHYWRECPMLIQCEFCQQVVEISMLRSHLCEECENGDAAHRVGSEMGAHHCPLCRSSVGQCEEQDWREHLLSGCPANPRRSGGGSRGQR